MSRARDNDRSMGPSNNGSEESSHKDASHLDRICKTWYTRESKEKPDVSIRTFNITEGLSQRMNKASQNIPQALPISGISPDQAIQDDIRELMMDSCAIQFKPVSSI